MSSAELDARHDQLVARALHLALSLAPLMPDHLRDLEQEAAMKRLFSERYRPHLSNFADPLWQSRRTRRRAMR